MSVMSAQEADLSAAGLPAAGGSPAGPSAPGAAAALTEGRRLALVPAPRPGRAGQGELRADNADPPAPRSAATRPATAALRAAPGQPGSRREAAPGRGSRAEKLASGDREAAPVRLTRRGRVVVTVLLAAAVTVVALLCASAAGRAQAASHGGTGRGGYQGMTQIVVQPGQTLWSLASAAEPAADTQVVVQQIIDANALGGTSLRAGQLLWVPRG